MPRHRTGGQAPASSPPEADKHHVMGRGIERRAVFREERDRAAFVGRVAALADAKGWMVVAWALLPNHAHLLVWATRRPLAAAMRSLLTGYVGAFNAPEAHKPTIGGQVAATTEPGIFFRTATRLSSSRVSTNSDCPSRRWPGSSAWRRPACGPVSPPGLDCWRRNGSRWRARQGRA